MSHVTLSEAMAYVIGSPAEEGSTADHVVIATISIGEVMLRVEFRLNNVAWQKKQYGSMQR